jgi:hypothetical protein
MVVYMPRKHGINPLCVLKDAARTQERERRNFAKFIVAVEFAYCKKFAGPRIRPIHSDVVKVNGDNR